MHQKDDSAWEEAQRLCRLSDEEVRMARELGFQPRSLIKNIPSPSQKWASSGESVVRQKPPNFMGVRVAILNGAPGIPRWNFLQA